MKESIIIVLNWNESHEKELCVVELFKCILKINKNGCFSGPLWNYNIEKDSYPTNLSIEQYDTIIELLSNKATQISDNKFLLENGIFVTMASIAISYNILFYKKKKGDIIKVNGLRNQDKLYSLFINKVEMHNNYKFFINAVCGNETIELKKECIFFQVRNLNFIIASSGIIFIDRFINDEFLNKIVENKYSLTKKQFAHFANRVHETSDHSIYFINLDVSCYIIDTSIQPTPCLYISFIDSKFYGKVQFLYDDYKVNYESNDEYIIDNHKKVYRNKSIEDEHLKLLKSMNWRKIRGSGYCYVSSNISKDIQVLLENNWIIYNQNKQKVRIMHNPNINITSNKDWFDLKLHYEIEGHIINIIELINQLDKGKQWIQINENNIYLIPKYIIDTKDVIKDYINNKNKIRISVQNIGDLRYLADQLQGAEFKVLDEYWNFNEVDLKISNELLKKLRDYQVYGVRWLKYLNVHNYNGVLADDMGLGKTLQVISLLSDIDVLSYNKSKSLIIVPNTLLYNWTNEFNKFNTTIKVALYHGNKRELDIFKNNCLDVIITTYGTIRNDSELLLTYEFNYIILDEAQVIKNFNSKTYRNISKLRANHKIILTGTPIENNLNELWGYMNYLNPGFLGTFNKFRKTYYTEDGGYNNLERLSKRVSPFILRRTKTQVLKELPEKVEQFIYCEMEEKQQLLYEAIKNKYRNEINNFDPHRIKSNSLLLEGLLYLREICCHPSLVKGLNVTNSRKSGKFERLKEILDNIYLGNNKVLIFSQFASMLQIIEKWLIEQAWGYSYLDGNTKNRMDIINNFEQSEDIKFFLISLKAGGVGINLTSANYVIIYDPWWNPAVENQAIDRVYRIGQTQKVIVYRLITMHSVEERVLELSRTKNIISEHILNNQDTVQNFTREEMMKLLLE